MEHEHRWCRETGSSACVCVECGAVFDPRDGTVSPPNPKMDPEFLAEFFAHCGCSPAMSEWINDIILENTIDK